jgi:hypothetical protein
MPGTGQGRPARPAPDPGPTIAQAVRALDGHAAGWALRRSVTPTSAAGISLALGLCAAAWFTAGTRAGDVNGALALCASYLTSRAAPPVAEPGSAVALAATAGAGSLARVCSATAEFSLYAGLAIGANAAGWSGTWKLAIAVTVLAAIRQTMSACGGAAEHRAMSASGGAERHRSGASALLNRATEATLTLSPGARVLLIAVAAPAAGAHAALSGLLAWEVAAAAYAIASHRRLASSDERAPGISAAVLACRDDGAFARSAGRLVRGQLVPFPPALAGVAAAALLAVLGLRDLPGIIALTPLVVLLLAAPGSSHPHDGRLDWLVPVVLQIGQYIYIAAIGFAAAVPAPVIFALCAIIAIRSADLADRGEPPQPDPGGALGWEGRMFAAGLGVVLGIATLSYLALSAYLGVLICRKVLTSCLASVEGDRR